MAAAAFLFNAGILLAAFLVWEMAFDRWPGIVEASQSGTLARQPEGILRDFRIAVVHCLLVGYLPAAFLAVVQGGKRTVLALQEALDCLDETRRYRGRSKQQVTLANPRKSGEQRRLLEVSPHLHISMPIELTSQLPEGLAAGLERLRPVYDWISRTSS